MNEEITTSWHSYSSIHSVGHRYVADILTVPVNVEEKVDGSQFSFGIFNGEIKCRSKGAQLIVDAPEKMFKAAVDVVKARASMLHDGWTYRGEYLGKPKHNVLNYNRTPIQNIIIFDINCGHEAFLPYEYKKMEAERLGFECVPLLFSGMVTDLAQFRSFLDTESILGGHKIEGVVVKPTEYNLFGQDKKVLMAKFVSEAFKEIHAGEWKKSNPTGKDIIGVLGQKYKSDARWLKALQHLREAGQIDDSPKDIGNLMVEIPKDIEKECIDEIKADLYAWAWPQIRRIAAAGVPEWYKEQLMKRQFEVQP